MADTPREGDTIIAARGMLQRGWPYVVTSVGPRNVHARGSRGDKRKFDRAKLELIDHDAGLWAEVTNG